jgi:hypothetical protein
MPRTLLLPCKRAEIRDVCRACLMRTRAGGGCMGERGGGAKGPGAARYNLLHLPSFPPLLLSACVSKEPHLHVGRMHVLKNSVWAGICARALLAGSVLCACSRTGSVDRLCVAIAKAVVLIQERKKEDEAARRSCLDAASPCSLECRKPPPQTAAPRSFLPLPLHPCKPRRACNVRPIPIEPSSYTLRSGDCAGRCSSFFGRGGRGVRAREE